MRELNRKTFEEEKIWDALVAACPPGGEVSSWEIAKTLGERRKRVAKILGSFVKKGLVERRQTRTRILRGRHPQTGQIEDHPTRVAVEPFWAIVSTPGKPGE